MDPLVHILLIAICLLLSAFFSGSETALLRLRSDEVERDVREASGPAPVAVRGLLKSTSRLLVTILLGNNLVNILGSSLSAALAIHYLGEKNGIIVATATMTALILICSEVVPKAIAARHPRRVSYAVGLPLYLLHRSLRPVHAVVDRLLEPLLGRILGGRDRDHASAEEVLRLARVARLSQHDGTPLAIIGAAAGAAEMTVSEIMVPRTEIVGYPVETPPDKLLESALAERYTRFPIYQDSIDRILGVVHLKDLIKLVNKGGTGAVLQSILKPVLRVPERMPILALLQDMQRAFVHVAIVKDEFEVTQGLLTQEDILEEIVGEIRDEFDREELLAIQPLADDEYQTLGRVKVLDFNREVGWSVPAEPGDTMSGLVFNALGRAPSRGDKIRVPGYELQVADVSGSRITHIRVRELLPEEGEEMISKQASAGSD